MRRDLTTRSIILELRDRFTPATRFAQLSQKRACPQGTSANPSRGATKHTPQVVFAAAFAAKCGTVDVVVGVAAVDWLSSPSSSLSQSVSSVYAS